MCIYLYIEHGSKPFQGSYFALEGGPPILWAFGQPGPELEPPVSRKRGLSWVSRLGLWEGSRASRITQSNQDPKYLTMGHLACPYGES